MQEQEIAKGKARQEEGPGACSGDSAKNTDGIDAKDWAWEESCHEGLLTFHDGKKRWYHCTTCQYFNDRLYHSKMHYERIHVRQGKSMPRKRKVKGGLACRGVGRSVPGGLGFKPRAL